MHSNKSIVSLTIKENGLTNNYIMAKRGAECWPTTKLLPCDTTPEGCDHFVIGKEYAVGQSYLLEERSHEEKASAIRAVLKSSQYLDGYDFLAAAMLANLPEVIDGAMPIIELCLSEEHDGLEALLAALNGPNSLRECKVFLDRPNAMGGVNPGGFPDDTACFTEELCGGLLEDGQEPYQSHLTFFVPLYGRSFMVSHLVTPQYRNGVIKASPHAVPILIRANTRSYRPAQQIQGRPVIHINGDALPSYDADVLQEAGSLFHAMWIKYLTCLRENQEHMDACRRSAEGKCERADFLTMGRYLLTGFLSYVVGQDWLDKDSATNIVEDIHERGRVI